MAVAHCEYPVVGVQFHPESAASEHGYALLDRFLRGERARAGELPVWADGAYESPDATLPRHDAPVFVPPPVDIVR
jgi:hypothetical protein